MVSNKNLVPTSRIAIVKFIYIHWFILKSQYQWEDAKKAIRESQNVGHLTSFWLGKTFVQVKNNFVYKVLNVAVLWSSNKHHPIMGEAFHSRFLPDLGTMTKFQFHLDCTLWWTKQSITKEICHFIMGRYRELYHFAYSFNTIGTPTCSFVSSQTWPLIDFYFRENYIDLRRSD